MGLTYNELLEEEKRLNDLIVKKCNCIEKLEDENAHLKEILAKQRELLDIMYDKIE